MLIFGIMKKSILLALIVCSMSFISIAQKVDSIREVKVILLDMPRSGEYIQPNFKIEESN